MGGWRLPPLYKVSNRVLSRVHVEACLTQCRAPALSYLKRGCRWQKRRSPQTRDAIASLHPIFILWFSVPSTTQPDKLDESRQEGGCTAPKWARGSIGRDANHLALFRIHHSAQFEDNPPAVIKPVTCSFVPPLAAGFFKPIIRKENRARERDRNGPSTNSIRDCLDEGTCRRYTIFVILRFISRRMARLKPQLNDWLLVVALILYIPCIVGFGSAALYGAGRHVILIKPEHRRIIRSINISDVTLYCVTLAFIKFSILSLLKLPTEKKAFVLLSFLLGARRGAPAGEASVLIWDNSACVVSVVRTAYTLDMSSTKDSSWDIIPGALVSTAELMTGILAACLPAYGPLVHRMMGRKTKTNGGAPDFNYATRVPSEQSYELMSDRNATYKRAHEVEAAVAGVDSLARYPEP
ncbi:hypothetical protein AAL_02438 [Moelleriella libera RCEF 2490]|uniref:Rhodopsin domain-containing protein n=1 Tax=Moelleriella libera RCEF 2490 TaxID=1081109 RepID=A0A168EKA5_9HYPO|nr:hypothetical protein AAL_02438 [Moelleriella libera RCEF 2490]